jgi:hypothetical protein
MHLPLPAYRVPIVHGRLTSRLENEGNGKLDERANAFVRFSRSTGRCQDEDQEGRKLRCSVCLADA